jgi:hypothetical protein
MFNPAETHLLGSHTHTAMGALMPGWGSSNQFKILELEIMDVLHTKCQETESSSHTATAYLIGGCGS